MCDDRRFERQRGGGCQSLLDIVSETAPPRKKNLHAKLGVFEITELWEKEGNRYRML